MLPTALLSPIMYLLQLHGIQCTTLIIRLFWLQESVNYLVCSLTEVVYLSPILLIHIY